VPPGAPLDAEVEELQQKANRSERLAARGAVRGEEYRAAVLALERARRQKEATWGRLPPAKAHAGEGEGGAAEKPGQDMLLREGVAAMASAEKLRDFFQYVIDRRVTLPRQKSALLPIAGKGVEGSRVSIYNENTQPKFPLLGLRLKNTFGLHLMQGPVTVSEGSTYAGDARVMDLQPNEERLLSYAVGLGTEVKPEAAADSGRLTQVKVVQGVLCIATKLREKKTYAVKNRNPQGRTVLIEHPVRDQFKLAGITMLAATARNAYRFEAQVPAGKTATQAVTEERNVGSAVQLTNSPDVFLQNTGPRSRSSSPSRWTRRGRWSPP
jgi:hypothetical protein